MPRFPNYIHQYFHATIFQSIFTAFSPFPTDNVDFGIWWNHKKNDDMDCDAIILLDGISKDIFWGENPENLRILFAASSILRCRFTRACSASVNERWQLSSPGAQRGLHSCFWVRQLCVEFVYSFIKWEKYDMCMILQTHKNNNKTHTNRCFCIFQFIIGCGGTMTPWHHDTMAPWHLDSRNRRFPPPASRWPSAASRRTSRRRTASPASCWPTTPQSRACAPLFFYSTKVVSEFMIYKTYRQFKPPLSKLCFQYFETVLSMCFFDKIVRIGLKTAECIPVQIFLQPTQQFWWIVGWDLRLNTHPVSKHMLFSSQLFARTLSSYDKLRKRVCAQRSALSWGSFDEWVYQECIYFLDLCLFVGLFCFSGNRTTMLRIALMKF